MGVIFQELAVLLFAEERTLAGLASPWGWLADGVHITLFGGYLVKCDLVYPRPQPPGLKFGATAVHVYVNPAIPGAGSMIPLLVFS